MKSEYDSLMMDLFISDIEKCLEDKNKLSVEDLTIRDAVRGLSDHIRFNKNTNGLSFESDILPEHLKDVSICDNGIEFTDGEHHLKIIR